MQFLLGTEDDDEEHIPHDLFTEMDEICVREGEDSEWRESARYRETVTPLTENLHTAMTCMSLLTAVTEWAVIVNMPMIPLTLMRDVAVCLSNCNSLL